MLDWAKAFDRIKPDCMCDVLGRSGIPADMVAMIRSIYEARYFIILDHTGSCTERQQRAGIAQGCTLSPYLFIIIQSAMLYDAFGQFDLQEDPAYVVTRDILHADDALLLSRHKQSMEDMLSAMSTE
eukprot:9489799-Pyramimonas_sp.AAC.1